MSEKENPVKKWNTLLNEQVAAGKRKAEAVRCLVRRYPGLHRAYLAATQPTKRQGNLVLESYPEVAADENQ